MKKDGILESLAKIQISGIERVLEGGEEIIDFIDGLVDRGMEGKKQKKERNALVLTPTRVILYHNKGFNYSSTDCPLRSIHSVDLNAGIVYADIKIHSGNDTLKMEKASRTKADAFVKNVKIMMSKVNNQTSNIQNFRTSPIDIADQIKKLADLKIQGFLTEEEFTAQKKKLLGL